MALLNAAALKKLPASAFAYIDSHGGRHLPIPNADHVRDAMARFKQTQFESDAARQAARGKIVAAARKFGVKVVNFDVSTQSVEDVLRSWLEDVLPLPDVAGVAHGVAFAADLGETTAERDDLVVRTGKLFECGEYPDKNFSFDEEDLQQAVAAFRPVPVDLEHIPTVLQGKLGQVTRIFPGEDGRSLMGDVALPAWLDTLLEQGNRRVSATWDRATKTLQGLALVRNPRVSDAALMAAFAAADPAFARQRHNTASGQHSLQRVHDVAVAHGAVCAVPAKMASRHEASAIQQVHDTTVEHGAQCEPSTDVLPHPNPGYFSSTTPPQKRGLRMNIREWLTGKAQEDGVDLDDLDAAFSGGDSTLRTEIEAKLAAKDQQIEALEAANRAASVHFARLADERRESEAATFAAGLVTAKRITPGAAEVLGPLAARIAKSDAAVTFAEGEKSTMALLQEFCDRLVDLSVFTTEGIAGDKVAALFNQTKTQGVGKDAPDQARVDALLKMTPAGRAVIAARGK